MSQGGGGAGAGAGGAVGGGGGGGGSKIVDILKSIGIPVGLGVLASGSPLAAMGVRTGMGAYSMFSENRRQKKLSELMAEYYGPGAGEKVEVPANAGDPAFGGSAGKFDLGGRDMAFKEGRDTQSPLGLGGGDRSLADTFGEAEPSMTAGAELSPNKISTLLSKKSAPAEKGAMGRDEFFAKMAASGGMTPMQIESLKAREEDRETSETRYQEGRETSEERYEDTIDYREGQTARSEETLGFSRRAADRADESLELQKSAGDRAVDREARITASSASDDARAERTFEMSVERFEMAKAQYEASQTLDVKEITSILGNLTSSIGDLQLRMRFAEGGDKEILAEQVEELRGMADTLQGMLKTGVAKQGELAAPPTRRRFDATGNPVQGP